MVEMLDAGRKTQDKLMQVETLARMADVLQKILIILMIVLRLNQMAVLWTQDSKF
jgi:hypothetical protein